MKLLGFPSLLALVLIGCTRPYAGQAHVSAVQAAGDVGGYIELGAYLDPGTGSHTGSPRVIALSEARCVDESLCEVALHDGVAVVGGKKEGQGDVRLSFVQPNGGETTVQVVTVRFSPRPTRTFTLGPPHDAPARTALVLERPSKQGEPSRYRCYGASPSRALDMGDVARGDARLYTCLPSVEVSPGHWYLSSQEDLSTTPRQQVWPRPREPFPRLMVCQHVTPRTGERASLVVYRDDGPGGLSQLSYEGEPSPVCSPVK